MAYAPHLYLATAFPRIAQHYRSEVERYPDLARQLGGCIYHVGGMWLGGVPLPELPAGPPYPITLAQFLGLHTMTPGAVGPRGPFSNAGLDPRYAEEVSGWGDYTIGSARYSRRDTLHEFSTAKYGRGYLALLAGKVVGATRLGWIWLHPEARRSGLSIQMGIYRWSRGFLGMLYLKSNWKQQYTPAGYSYSRRLYDALTARGIIAAVPDKG